MALQDEDNKFECLSDVNNEQELFFLNVYKKHEVILNNNDEPFEKKIESIIDVWKSIAELDLGQFHIRHVIQIMDWAKLHALNIVLTAKWNDYKASCQSRLLEEIEKAQDKLLKLNDIFATRCRKLSDVVKNPWEDPVLMRLMRTKDAKIGLEEIEFFCVETAYLVSVRLKKLCESQCEDLALNLVTAFMNCNELSKTKKFSLNASESQMWFIFDIYIALLYKFQEKQKIVLLLKQLTFHEGLQLIKRFSKKRVKISKIWKNCQRVAILAIQMYISQAVVKYTEDLRDVLIDYLTIYLSLCNTDTLLQDFTNSIRRISNLADAPGLYIFCDVIYRKAGVELKPLVIEMYIRALTTDINDLERQKDANENETVAVITSRLAMAFCNLAEFLNDHVKVARECILTAFSLEPTKERLKLIEELAKKSGFNVLDTGQNWKCKLHPPALPTDEVTWMCPECGDWMCTPERNVPKINITLHDALQNSVLGISEALCDDLVVCLSYPRYQILSWFMPWEDLHRICVMYLQHPKTTKNFITDLKFVDIDYSIFKDIKREPVDDLAGIERGYEQYLDHDFVSCESSDTNSEGSISQDSRPYSLGSDGAGESAYTGVLPVQQKSDPNTLKSLRMFRPNLKRKEKDLDDSEKLFQQDGCLAKKKSLKSDFMTDLSQYLNSVTPQDISNIEMENRLLSESKNVQSATLPLPGGQVAKIPMKLIKVNLQPLNMDQLENSLQKCKQVQDLKFTSNMKETKATLPNKLLLNGSKENNNYKSDKNQDTTKIVWKELIVKLPVMNLTLGLQKLTKDYQTTEVMNLPIPSMNHQELDYLHQETSSQQICPETDLIQAIQQDTKSAQICQEVNPMSAIQIPDQEENSTLIHQNTETMPQMKPQEAQNIQRHLSYQDTSLVQVTNQPTELSENRVLKFNLQVNLCRLTLTNQTYNIKNFKTCYCMKGLVPQKTQFNLRSPKKNLHQKRFPVPKFLNVRQPRMKVPKKRICPPKIVLKKDAVQHFIKYQMKSNWQWPVPGWQNQVRDLDLGIGKVLDKSHYTVHQLIQKPRESNTDIVFHPEATPLDQNHGNGPLNLAIVQVSRPSWNHSNCEISETSIWQKLTINMDQVIERSKVTQHPWNHYKSYVYHISNTKGKVLRNWTYPQAIRKRMYSPVRASRLPVKAMLDNILPDLISISLESLIQRVKQQQRNQRVCQAFVQRKKNRVSFSSHVTVYREKIVSQAELENIKLTSQLLPTTNIVPSSQIMIQEKAKQTHRTMSLPAGPVPKEEQQQKTNQENGHLNVTRLPQISHKITKKQSKAIQCSLAVYYKDTNQNHIRSNNHPVQSQTVPNSNQLMNIKTNIPSTRQVSIQDNSRPIKHQEQINQEILTDVNLSSSQNTTTKTHESQTVAIKNENDFYSNNPTGNINFQSMNKIKEEKNITHEINCQTTSKSLVTSQPLFPNNHKSNANCWRMDDIIQPENSIELIDNEFPNVSENNFDISLTDSNLPTTNKNITLPSSDFNDSKDKSVTESYNSFEYENLFESRSSNLTNNIKNYSRKKTNKNCNDSKIHSNNIQKIKKSKTIVVILDRSNDQEELNKNVVNGVKHEGEKTLLKTSRRRKSTDNENKNEKCPNVSQSHRITPLQDINPRVLPKSCCDLNSVTKMDLKDTDRNKGDSTDKEYVKSVLANVPGLNDFELLRPSNVNPIVNVVQVSVSRTPQNIAIQNTQNTSTQVSPHIQRIGQPRIGDQKPEQTSTSCVMVTIPTSTTTNVKSHTSQPSTLINILSQQVINTSGSTPQNNIVRRPAPLINILSQQIIRPSQTSKTSANNITVPTSTVETTIQSNQVSSVVTTAATCESSNVTTLKSTAACVKNVNTVATGQGSTILQFICKSSLPKFQQAFGKTVYQSSTENVNTISAVESSSVNTDVKKTVTKAVPVSIQPIQGSVIYSRQVPVGQTISLIPPGGTTRQVFRIATSNPEQISLVKDSAIHSRMSALLAAALQNRPKNTEDVQINCDESTKVTLTRPTLVQNARIVKPVQLQLPTNVVRTTPPANVSSTTLEQLREFDMVYKQIKERSSSTTLEGNVSSSDSQEVTSQRISVTYVNQLPKYTQLSPVVVVTSSLQPAASPALSVTSQGSSSPCLITGSTTTLPKISTKNSKGKTLKNTTTNSSTKSSPIPKPQQKPQEDEHTTQRIFDILAEYAEQLRNSPDLNNKPAPRRRSNPPTNPSQSSKRKKNSNSKKTNQTNSTIEVDPDEMTVGSEDSSGGGIIQLSVTDDEQSQAATTATTSDSNENSNPPSTRPVILSENSIGTQSRNVIIADSTVGEALKMPNTAVIVPGSYIMPVSMVKGGQQIAVVSGGSKILATVPTRSGQNMLLFQSFTNQNRKGAISAVKYSTVQPISGISSQSLAGVSAQPPVILPSNSVATAVALGQPITLKKVEERDANEIVLTISPPKDEQTTSINEVTQLDNNTNKTENIDINKEDIKSEEQSLQSDNSDKIFQTYQKSVITNSTGTSVIATCQNIKSDDDNRAHNIINVDLSSNNVKNESKPNARVQSVLVTACTSNGPMFSHGTPRYKKPEIGRVNNNTDQTNKEEFINNGEKTNNESKIFRSNSNYYSNKTKKVSMDSQKVDSDIQKQAVIERELRLQKSLSEECEDLGVDEPSTSDLFPEADLLFDSNHSPSFDQTSQDIIKRSQSSEIKEVKNLFSDDDASNSLRTDLFEYVEYHTVDSGLDEYQTGQLINGNANSNESGLSGSEDNTLLPKCATMSDVTLNSPISPEMYQESCLNKFKFKYSNRKKGEKVKATDFIEVVSSSEETVEHSDLNKGSCDDDNYKAMHIDINKSSSHVKEDRCELHCEDEQDSPSGRGARRSVRKLCSCCNGSQDSIILSRKRPHSSRPQTPAPHKKNLLAKKR